MVSKGSVNYRDASPGDGRRCGTCSMFRPPASCTLVTGDIRPDDLCDRWAPAAAALSAGREAEAAALRGREIEILALRRSLRGG